MIDAPEIVQTAAQPAAIIHITCSRTEIAGAMDPGIQELLAAVTAQGIGPAGPIFSHHLRLAPDLFDFELGIPVTAPVTPVGRVTAGELPAAKVARTVYHGPYDGLGAAWGEFVAWVAASGHSPAEDFWERYVSGPEASPDPADWRTELNRALVS
jgi:effector-binding domain-containing protein